MTDAIIIAILLFIVGLSGYYIYRAKKSGKKCIGCPDSGTCHKKENGCSCGCQNEE